MLFSTKLVKVAPCWTAMLVEITGKMICQSGKPEKHPVLDS